MDAEGIKKKEKEFSFLSLKKNLINNVFSYLDKKQAFYFSISNKKLVRMLFEDIEYKRKPFALKISKIRCKDCQSKIIGYCICCTKFACLKCDIKPSTDPSKRFLPTCSVCKKQCVTVGLENMAKHFYYMWLDIYNKRIIPETHAAFKNHCEYCKNTVDTSKLEKDICLTCCTTHVKEGKCLHCTN